MNKLHLVVGRRPDHHTSLDYATAARVEPLMRTRRDLENIPPWQTAKAKLLKEFTYPKGGWTERRFKRLLKEVEQAAAYKARKQFIEALKLRQVDESIQETQQDDLEEVATGAPA